jgi:two-component system, chemotaxis family, response regulator WspF
MKIAIVNDSFMAVEAMRRVVVRAPGHRLAWIARDGAEAIEQCARDTPDLILMDLIMPKMDGVEATRRIMAKTPCAVVVVTANVRNSSSKVFEAMGAGALDAVNTPVLDHPGTLDGAKALLAKIETISRLIGAGAARKPVSPAEQAVRLPDLQQDALVAVGASAGGPAALAKVLACLPADFPAAVVIVQHVDVQFAQGLADWLAYQTPLRVRLAQEGDRPQASLVLLAGKEHHLAFASPTRLTYKRQPLDASYRPSVDVFFKSVDRFWQGRAVGVLLTGMGRDGAEGLKLLRERGHCTIAQDAATSAVYGMPKAAAELNAAAEILALDKIGPRLTIMLAQKAKSHAGKSH